MSVRNALGYTGIITSLVLFCSPIGTFRYAAPGLVGLHPYPYLGGVISCVWGIFYAVLRTGNRSVVIVNSSGVASQMVALGWFWYNTTNNLHKRIIVIGFIVSGVVLGILAAINLECVPLESRIEVGGILYTIFNILYYASPLTVMWEVVMEENSAGISIWMSLAALLNTATWIAYSFIHPRDIFIMITNIAGAACAVVQIILRCVYPSTVRAAIEVQEAVPLI